MDVKEAVLSAKGYVRNLYADTDENVSNVGLEEVEFDPESNTWNITIGFSRAWDSPFDFLSDLKTKPMRSYKVVRLSDSGHVLSFKDRMT